MFHGAGKNRECFWMVWGVVLVFASTLMLSPEVQAKGKSSRRSPKKVAAVSSFQYKGQGYYWNSSKVGDGMRSMLVEALLESGRFTIVERGEGLSDIQAEQRLKNSGASRGGGAKTGKLMAAQFLFKGEVTDFTPKQQGAKVGLSRFKGPLSRFKAEVSNASVSVLVRYFDTSSGEVLDSCQASKKISSVGFNVSGYKGVKFGTSAFSKTPIGKATNAVIKDVAGCLVKKIGPIPFECKVVKSSAGKIYLNVGSDGGVSPGDKFRVFSVGEELVDPESGMTLGAEEELVGTVTLVKIQPKYSVGKMDPEKASRVSAGDVARELK